MRNKTDRTKAKAAAKPIAPISQAPSPLPAVPNQPSAGATVTRNLKVVRFNEPWAEYELEDGTVVRTRFLLSKFTRTDGRYAPDGQPEYAWWQEPAISVQALPGQCKPKKLGS